MKLFSKMITGAAFLSLASCETSPEAIKAASFTYEETKSAVDLFSDFCLSTLPNFERAPKQAEKLGLIPKKSPKGKEYTLPGDKPLFTMIFEEGPYKACAINFAGTPDAAAVSKLFLPQVLAKTGGKPKEVLSASHLEYVGHMNNGSVFINGVNRETGQTRHIFLISSPVSKSEVATLISN